MDQIQYVAYLNIVSAYNNGCKGLQNNRIMESAQRQSAIFRLMSCSPRRIVGWIGVLAPVVGTVVWRIFLRTGYRMTLNLVILRVDVHPLLVPQHDLVAAVSRQVDDLCTHLWVSILRKTNYLPVEAVYEAALFDISVQQDQVLAIAGPVYRRNHVAVR